MSRLAANDTAAVPCPGRDIILFDYSCTLPFDLPPPCLNLLLSLPYHFRYLHLLPYNGLCRQGEGGDTHLLLAAVVLPINRFAPLLLLPQHYEAFSALLGATQSILFTTQVGFLGHRFRNSPSSRQPARSVGGLTSRPQSSGATRTPQRSSCCCHIGSVPQTSLLVDHLDRCLGVNLVCPRRCHLRGCHHY